MASGFSFTQAPKTGGFSFGGASNPNPNINANPIPNFDGNPKSTFGGHQAGGSNFQGFGGYDQRANAAPFGATPSGGYHQSQSPFGAPPSGGFTRPPFGAAPSQPPAATPVASAASAASRRTEGRKRQPKSPAEQKLESELQQAKIKQFLEKVKLTDPIESAKGLESISKCSICQSGLRNPKTLACLHSFCLGCLEKQTQKEKSPYRCAVCMASFVVPATGLTSLKTSPLLDFLQPTSSPISSPSSDPNTVKCQMCEGEEEATIHCVECEQFLGPQCSGFHGRSPASKHHKIQLIDEYFVKTGGKQVSSRISRCQKHPSQVVNVYCKSCKVIVCSECVVASHSGHQFCPLQEESERLKRELIIITSAIAVREKGAEKGVNTFVQTLGEVEELKIVAGIEVRKAFAALRADIDTREAEIVGNLEDLAHLMKKAIKVDKEETEFAFAEFKGYREMGETVIFGGTDAEVSASHSMLMTRGKTLEELGYLDAPAQQPVIRFSPINLDLVKEAISFFGAIEE